MSATPVLHRLYVTGRGPRSEAAAAAVRSAVGFADAGIEVEIVDVTEAPGEAEAAGILLTPTLVRPVGPGTVRRWVGDFTDPARLEASGVPESLECARTGGTAPEPSPAPGTEAAGSPGLAEEAERRFRVVAETSADAILVVGPDGIVRFATERADALLGGPERRLVGLELGVPVVGAEPVEIEGVGAAARLRLEMRASPIRWNGVPASLVVLRDLTHHRALEERLRQAQKMEALGQLTGGIAHDFNNVLTVILTGADMLRETVPAESVEAHAELRDIETAAGRAAGMVRRLLGFSRRGYLRFETIDLRSFAEEAFALMRRVLSTDVELGMSIADDVGRIRADPAALQQVFLNVATNARDAMPQGGTVRVTCAPVTVEETDPLRHPWVRPGRYESVAIADTGIGMDERVRAQIFEPFFTTKEAGTGTGLGMAMVYGLMKQHRGVVHVYSEPGRGTRVELLFPTAAEGLEPYRPPSSPERTRGRGETILVIEDEPALRRGIERILTRAGYGVLLARDGAEGLEIYRRASRVDLVLSDLVMPKLGGRDVLQTLRRENDGCPFLLLTGYGPASVRDLTDMGAILVSKPWTREQLLEKVQEALAPPTGAGRIAGGDG